MGEIPAELAEQAHEYHHQLIDAISHFDDEVLEAYIEDESSVTPDQIKRALRAGTLADEITPVLLGSAFKNKGVQPLLDAVIDYLPSPLDVPPVVGHRPEDRGGAERARDDGRAVLGARLQGHVRPVRRQAHLLPRLQRQAQGRRPRAQHDAPARPSASAASCRCTRTTARSARRSARARSRPASGSRTRRPATRSSAETAPIVLESMTLPRAGHLGRRRAEVEGRPGQARLGLARLAEEDPTFRVTYRRGDRADADRRHGRAAPRDHRRPPQARVQRRRERRAAAGRLPRDDLAARAEKIQGRFVRQTGGSGQYGDAVINLLPAGARRRLRVRRQDRRRQDPEGVHHAGRRGHPGGDGLGRPRRATRSSTSRSSSSTAPTTTSTRASARSRSPARWPSRRR